VSAGSGRLDARASTWILATALVPAIVAVVQLGRIHPDEVYQLLEPAYARAFGYGVRSWEWEIGLRNWALPGSFAALLRLCAALGIDHPRAYRAVLELPQYALHAATLAAIYVYAARRVSSELAVWAVLAVGLYAPVVSFAGRTLSESFSAAFVVIACALLDGAPSDSPAATGSSGRWRPLAAGVALGLAVVARYPSAVFVATTLGWVLAARDSRTLGWLVAGGALVAILLALLDWATWGAPFHSLLAYLDFNLISGKAARSYGRKPVFFYVARLLRWAPLWAWPGLVWAVRQKAPRVPLPALLAFVYLLVISIAPHKEPRFAYPALVLFAMAAVPGILGAIERRMSAERRRLGALVVVTVSLGHYFFLGTGLVAERGEAFRAIIRATRHEATGLLVLNDGVWGAGGYFYIGKRIPWLASGKGSDPAYLAALETPEYNRAVTYDDVALPELLRAGFHVTERIGRAAILERERAGALR
jgi:4-amino-4-deoxy-L-arabinose transferase-like glycosyltransferase